MRVALVDPSLFTMPYDVAFGSALRGAGIDVVLHGRTWRPEDGRNRGLPVVPTFYKLSESARLRKLPSPLRLVVKGLDHLWGMRLLRSRMIAFKPDIIHFQWFPLPGVDVWHIQSLRRLAPVVLTVHDTNPFNGSPTGSLQRLGFQRSITSCDHLFVHTLQGLERLQEMGVPGRKLSRISHGPLDVSQSRETADPMLGTLTFTLFGKIKPYKGSDVLIRAFAKLPENLRNQARIRIVGQPYMDVTLLTALADQMGVAARLDVDPRFVADEELPEIFSRSTVAVFPYLEIEASGVLSLALAAGRPIVASRLGCFTDTIVDDRHGRLVPPNDPDSLCAAMAAMIADRSLSARYAAAAHDLSAELPGWSEIVEHVRDVYEGLVADRLTSGFERSATPLVSEQAS